MAQKWRVVSPVAVPIGIDRCGSFRSPDMLTPAETTNNESRHLNSLRLCPEPVLANDQLS